MKKFKQNLLSILSLVGLVVFFWSAIPLATGVMNVGSGFAMAVGLIGAVYCLLSLKYPKETIPYKKDQDEAYLAKIQQARCKKEHEKSGHRSTVLFGMRNVDLEEYDANYDETHMAGLAVSREARDVIDKIALVILIIVIVFVGSMSAMLLSYDRFDGNFNNKTVVVLGAKVDGDQPSIILGHRLDKAVELMKTADDDVKCIVTGGQGEDEAFTESSVMKNYMVEKGVPEDKIIEENQASNTRENIANSKEIAEKGGLNKEFVLVTQGFHQHRANEYAKEAGVDSVGAKAYTSKGLWIGYWSRECIAVFAELIGVN